MLKKILTSESVTRGHPDKVADQISDAIVDACLREDPFSRVACETLVSENLVVIAGEISSKAQVDYAHIARQMIEKIGYSNPELGFSTTSCRWIISIQNQSSDIAQGVNHSQDDPLSTGSGDQGMMVGYACDETPTYMPLSYHLARLLTQQLTFAREHRKLPYLRPDGKAQVSVEYDEKGKPSRIHTVVISTQHAPEVSQEEILKDIKQIILPHLWPLSVDANTRLLINPTGRFVKGGPAADTGLTGRKIIVDTYGSIGRHGGGAFSGKDPTKVDRSAAYAMRYLAKNIVAAGLAKEAEVHIAYSIGLSQPLAFRVETFGTAICPEETITKACLKLFDMRPESIIRFFDLRRPIYQDIAYDGHFGRENLDLPWECLDLKEALRKECQ
jgi:S-adenosylmethionine synthetase